MASDVRSILKYYSVYSEQDKEGSIINPNKSICLDHK